MSYFSKFPIINFYEIDQQKVIGLDVTRRKRIPLSVKSDESIYFNYDVRDGETPEILADRLYNDAGLYWIVCELNNIVDVETQWVLDQNSLERYIARKYEDPNAIMQYESISTGAVVDAIYTEWDRIPVTYREYEIRENEKKRTIKMLLPGYVGNFKEANRR